MDSRPRSYDIPCVTIITLSSPRPWKPFDDRLGHRHLLSRHSDRIFNGRRKARIGTTMRLPLRQAEPKGPYRLFWRSWSRKRCSPHASVSARPFGWRSQLQSSPKLLISSKTSVTWSKRNSTATLFMASLWKMLAKIRDHARQSSNVSAVEEARSQYERARGHPA